MASREALERDPANDLFTRFDLRRLSAEELRDSVLLVSGNLNRKVYGPSVYPKLSAEVLATQSKPGDGWGKSSPEDQARRSVYVYVKRSLLSPLLTAFDFPDPDTSCEARFNTSQPAQAFAMLHGEFLHQQARLLAERVRASAGDEPRAQIAEAYRVVLGRTPSTDELASAEKLLAKLADEHRLDAFEALRYYCLSVLNYSEFVYVD